MRIRVTSICRGDARTYFRVSVQGLEENAHVKLRAQLGDGQPVCSMLFEADSSEGRREFVGVIPLLDVAVTLKLFAGREGAETAVFSRMYPADAMKLSSRMNYKFHADDVALVRDFENGRMTDRAVVEFRECQLTGGGDQYLLRGMISIPQSLSAGPFAIGCFDACWNRADADCTLFDSMEVRQSDWHAAPLTRQGFTVRLPRDCSLATVCILDNTGEPIEGFNALEAWQIADMAHRAADLYRSAAIDEAYDGWFQARRAQGAKLELQRRHGVEGGPSFAVVAPVIHTSPALLEELLESVRAQTYPDWRLVLVGSGSSDAELSAVARNAQESDPRITLVEREGGESAALNDVTGSGRIAGDYVCLLDQDGVLEPDALYEYARAIAGDPAIDFLYCDEDRISPDSRFVEPFFKPDFSIDLERCVNYVGHFLTMRASILESLPVADEGSAEARMHSLALAASETARAVHHVPKVLYHTRLTAEETTGGTNGLEADADAVRAHLARCNIAAQVTSAGPGSCRVDCEVTGTPTASAIIPFSGDETQLERCLKSLVDNTADLSFNIIIADRTGTLDQATATSLLPGPCEAPLPEIVMCAAQGKGIYEALNEGARRSTSDFLVMLGGACEVVAPRWLTTLIGYAQREDVGAVGACILHEDDTVAHAGIELTSMGMPVHLAANLDRRDRGYYGLVNRPRSTAAVSIDCLLTKRSTFSKVGGFDPQFTTRYGDMDYCLKLSEEGLTTVYTPYVELRKQGEAPFEITEPTEDDRVLIHEQYAHFVNRHSKATVHGSPFFNPNLCQYTPAANYYHLS